MDASSENDDNRPNRPGASASDGHEGVHFGWSDEIVDEDSSEAHEDSGESDWLGRDQLLSDDDEEVNAIGAHFRVVKKKIRNKTVLATDLQPPLNLSFVVENENDARNAEVENEANRNRPAESGVNEKEAYGIGENETYGADENDTEENEVSSVGLSTCEETDYLGSSDVGSYETDKDGDFVSMKTSKVFFDSSTSEPRFELGMIFENGKQFKDALYAYVVAHRFDFLFVSNRKEKVRVVCKGKGCPFVVHASWDKSDSCFKIKTLVTDHNCSVTFKNKRANYKFVGKHFISKIRIVPKLRLVDMIRLGREELNVELNKQLCCRAKKWAEEKIKGNIIHEFNRLFDYVLALRTVDPDGSFDLVVERPTAVDIPKFRRLYAYVCQLEKDHKGGGLQLLFWNYCKATTQPLFRKHADRICKIKPKAYADLMEKDPSHWSKAFFSTRCKCDAIDNNFCEAFNSAIIGARFKYIISMFEDIRHYVMHRLVEHKKKSISWKGEFCPRIAKKLEEHKARSSFCHVIWNGADGYEVMHNEDRFFVDVRGWKCTCKVWDLTGITCPHVVCVILYREESLENYVLHLYKKEVYQELYSVVIPTIPSEKYWQDSGMGKIDPPLKRKLPGRPKDKRKKEEGEVKCKNKLRNLGAKISCRCCGLIGNNIRTCPKKQQANVQNHANQPPPMATHPGPSSSIPSDPPPVIGPFSPPYSIRQSAPQPSTGPSSPPHSTIPSTPQPSNGPSFPPHSTLPSAQQSSTGPSSPPHSTIPSAPPMVFMPTPSVQPSLAFDSTSPPVTRITTFSPKRKVTANRMPLYRKSREHATPSTTVIPPISSQPTATVNVPQEGKGRPPKLTIWKP
ncbi:hypothetical protein GQ457_11G022940 [Hibiscus cannabinus]